MRFMKKTLLLLAAVPLFFWSCGSGTDSSTAGHIQENTEKQMDDSAVAHYIEQYITQLDSENTTIGDEFIFSTTVMPGAYKTQNYRPLWADDKTRKDAVEELKRAGKHGLLSEDYHIETIKQFEQNAGNLSSEDFARYDILLTDGVILFAYHLIKGKLRPESIDPTWNYKKPELPANINRLLIESINRGKVIENLHKLEPKNREYHRLKSVLERYTLLAENGGWEQVSFDKTVHPGETHPSVPSLRKRLAAEAYLSENEVNDSDVYDDALVAAVKDFQAHHGLHPDGVLGKTTVARINVSAEEKRKTILTNLERMRWIDIDRTEPHIRVNIASFRLDYIENDTVAYTTNVMVGKAQKETPVFTDELELIVFNPTWTVPYSISSTETLSKLKRDPDYLRKHNMVLLDRHGNPVDATAIDWSNYSENHFPFTVRQEPGPKNSLGRVKFLFPNQYAIYLHDTPSKYLFAKEERAFSHGCIRVQNPLDLALFLLSKEDSSWSNEKIDAIIKDGKTTTITLKNKIPIYLLYQTVEINENNEPVFYPDIYSRDAVIYPMIVQPESEKEISRSRIGS